MNLTINRQAFKEAMHKDLAKIKKLDKGIYIITLQQEVLLFSLAESIRYYDSTGYLPREVADSIFKEASIGMREMFPTIFSAGAMQAFKTKYNQILSNISQAKIIVAASYASLNSAEQPTANGGNTIEFYSSRHIRIENISLSYPKQWPINYAQRLIKLHYTNLGRTLTVDIYPTLTAKRATLVQDKEDVLKYIGDDPDFIFEIETKSDNTIKRFSLYRKDKDLEIRYLE